MAAAPTDLTPIELELFEVIFSSKGLIGLFLIVSGILWFLLPFAVFGIKGRLDSLVTNTTITNKKFDLILQEISILNKLLKESIEVNKTPVFNIVDTQKTVENKVSDSPLCSKCNIPMQVKTVTKGEQQGKQFYVCSNYPTCREVYKFET